MPKVTSTPVAKSVPFDNTSNSFTSTETQSAIEEAKLNAEGFPRAGIVLIANGTANNNDWICYNELVSGNKIVFPVNTKLNELTWTNTKVNVSFNLEIYKNGIAGGNLVYTYTVTSDADGLGYLAGINLSFNAGDWIRVKYIDTGTNCSDLVVTLWISRIA